MAKRVAEDEADGGVSLKSGERPQRPQSIHEGESFEDEFEDEYESEDEIMEAGVDGQPDQEREAEEKGNAMDVDKRTFIPGRDQLQNGESLAPDSSAYELLHGLSVTWPCLSFDIIPDALGENRKTYPATLYAVAGTQAESHRPRDNELVVMKLSGLSRTERKDDDDDDDDEETAEPILETKSIPMTTTTNRVRAHQFPQSNSATPPTTLTATMTESAELLIHNITPHLQSFDWPGTTITPQQSRAIATLKPHQSEGYALAWSPNHPTGKLVSGDNDGKIFLHSADPTSFTKWTTDTRPFVGHEGSIEDIAWAPTEKDVFASASSDGTICVWDVRMQSRRPALTVKVSNTDVNVLSWNKQRDYLLASGADDGVWAVWDLRAWKTAAGGKSGQIVESTPVAKYDFHKEQITSIEWHPTDDSVVCVAAGDNLITLWDLGVELDDEEARGSAAAEGVPPQLLFLHYMESAKEAHWHPQIPGMVVGTGLGGAGEGRFSVFKSISV